MYNIHTKATLQMQRYPHSNFTIHKVRQAFFYMRENVGGILCFYHLRHFYCMTIILLAAFSKLALQGSSWTNHVSHMISIQVIIQIENVQVCTCNGLYTLSRRRSNIKIAQYETNKTPAHL